MLLLRGEALPFCWLELYSFLLLDVLDDRHIRVDVRANAWVIDSYFDAVGARWKLLRFVSNLLRRELVGKGMNKLDLVGLIAEGNNLRPILKRWLLLLQIGKVGLLRTL